MSCKPVSAESQCISSAGRHRSSGRAIVTLLFPLFWQSIAPALSPSSLLFSLPRSNSLGPLVLFQLVGWLRSSLILLFPSPHTCFSLSLSLNRFCPSPSPPLSSPSKPRYKADRSRSPSLQLSLMLWGVLDFWLRTRRRCLRLWRFLRMPWKK